MIKRAKDRADNWRITVDHRVNTTVSDLHAADARYHGDCIEIIYANHPSGSGCSRQSSQDDKVIEKLKSFLESRNIATCSSARTTEQSA